jgi:hypothetical protein
MRARTGAWICGILVGLVLAAPAQAANPQLAGLQVALRSHGLYLGPIDGIAGPRTVAAVRAFQRRSGLHVDGIAGPETRRALGPLGQPLFGNRRVLGLGSFGWDVAVLQFTLARAGTYDGSLDGYYGREVLRAVRQFQRRARLATDGIAGPRTLRALARRWAIPVSTPERRYRVKPGDTLSALAVRFDTTVGALARANGLRPGRVLRTGVRLRLPATA